MVSLTDPAAKQVVAATGKARGRPPLPENVVRHMLADPVFSGLMIAAQKEAGLLATGRAQKPMNGVFIVMETELNGDLHMQDPQNAKGPVPFDKQYINWLAVDEDWQPSVPRPDMKALMGREFRFSSAGEFYGFNCDPTDPTIPDLSHLVGEKLRCYVQPAPFQVFCNRWNEIVAQPLIEL